MAPRRPGQIALCRVWVIDASAGAKLALQERDSDLADRLLAECVTKRASCLLVVPDLFFAECASVLRKAVRAGRLCGDDANQAMDELVLLGFASVPTHALARQALAIATRTGITAYDACYVALAVEVDGTLVTEDAELRSRVAQGTWRAVSLADACAAQSASEV